MSKKTARLATSGLAALLISCSNPFGTSREITLSLADIEVPASITLSGPLDVVAIVRTGGCVTFLRFDVARAGSTVLIEAIGSDASGPRINCPTDIRVERRALRVNGSFADSVFVAGKQPDGTVLRRRVLVRGGACLLFVTVMPPALHLPLGDSARVRASTPCGASNEGFHWSSQRPDVASVSHDGLVTARAVGTVALIARLRADTTVFGAVATTVRP